MDSEEAIDAEIKQEEVELLENLPLLFEEIKAFGGKRSDALEKVLEGNMKEHALTALYAFSLTSGPHLASRLLFSLGMGVTSYALGKVLYDMAKEMRGFLREAMDNAPTERSLET